MVYIALSKYSSLASTHLQVVYADDIENLCQERGIWDIIEKYFEPMEVTK